MGSENQPDRKNNGSGPKDVCRLCAVRRKRDNGGWREDGFHVRKAAGILYAMRMSYEAVIPKVYHEMGLAFQKHWNSSLNFGARPPVCRTRRRNSHLPLRSKLRCLKNDNSAREIFCIFSTNTSPKSAFIINEWKEKPV